MAGFNLPKDLADRVKVEADARGVTMSWFLGKLVAEGLDQLIPVEEFSLTRKRNDG